MEPVACPPADRIRALADGNWPDPPEYVEQHLLTCDHCARQAATIDVSDPLIATLRSLNRDGPCGQTYASDVIDGLMSRLNGLPSLHRALTADEVRSPEDHAALLDDLRGLWEPPQRADEIGRLGGYRIVRLLGSGGMGVVMLAEDLRLHRPVALKLLHPHKSGRSDASHRFLREARTAAAIRHDNIVSVYQVGDERGIPFLAMEFLEGETLEDRLRRCESLPIDEVLRIGRQMSAGLAAAHAQGIVHRDIKPSNVWLDAQTDRAKLLDFGLARLLDVDVGLTAPGVVLGTPAYMSPEQAAGETVDARTDLFSLGAVLYRMATGRLPFPGQNVLQILKALATAAPTPPASVTLAVPQSLSQLIMRLLSKQTEDRPESATDVARELERIAASHVEGQTTPRRRAIFRLTAFRWIAGTSAGGLCLLLAVLIPKNSADNGSKPGPLNENRKTPPPAAAHADPPADTNPSLNVSDQNVDPDEPIWAVKLDGLDDAVWSPANVSLHTEDFTFEAWVTPLSDKTGNIVWIGSPRWSTLQILFRKFTFVVVRDRESRFINQDVSVTVGRRVHVAAVYHDRNLTLFVDGQPFVRDRNERGQPTDWLHPGPLTIGGFSTKKGPITDGPEKEAYFEGLVDEVRVSAFARYHEAFVPPQEFASGDWRDLAIYHFNEGQGTTIKNAAYVGNRADGFLVGGEWVRCTRTGKLLNEPTAPDAAQPSTVGTQSARTDS